MRYVVKFLGLIGLGLGVIYTFYINGNVSSYGFWAWTLSVIVSLLTLCNVASLIAALNYSSYNEDKVDDEKGMLVLSSFLGFLIYCGIFFFCCKRRRMYMIWHMLICLQSFSAWVLQRS